MEKCNLCPRNCGVDRTKNLGFCQENEIRIAQVMLHKWEEPIISGTENTRGSGAIFFSGCNLKCVYCQNKDISRGNVGKVVTPHKLAKIIKELEQDGAYNINFVSPSHFTDKIIEALKIYKPKIPIVWNTSGYEKAETIEKLKGFVDIFLTDFKYVSSELAKEYSNAQDYFNYLAKAIIKMREITGRDEIEDGIMKKGIIVRHMVLPGETKDSVAVLNWIYNNLGNSTIVSIMGQYTPNGELLCYPKLNRPITKIEYNRVVKKAIELGFSNAFIQNLSSSSTEYIPNFFEKNKYL